MSNDYSKVVGGWEGLDDTQRQQFSLYINYEDGTFDAITLNHMTEKELAYLVNALQSVVRPGVKIEGDL